MSSKKSKKKDKNIKTAVAVVAAIVVIIIIAKYAFPSGELAATVNGEKIYKEDVLREYLKVPVELRQVITAESILQGMIVEKLVIQEAAKLGISVSNAEIEDYLQDILNIYGVTEENLPQSLKENGLTLEEFKLSLKKKLTIG